MAAKRTKERKSNIGTYKLCKCGKKYKRLPYYTSKCMKCMAKDNRPTRIKRYKINRRLWWDYLLARGCCRCRLRDPRCLEADHVRGKKRMEVSRMIVEGYSWKKSILPELNKCRIICSNCERISTSYQLRYWHRRKRLPPEVMRWSRFVRAKKSKWNAKPGSTTTRWRKENLDVRFLLHHLSYPLVSKR